MNSIPAEWGTAVNVQAMVYGNMGNDCATGPWSEEISVTTGSQPSYFDIVRLETEIVDVETRKKDGKCDVYIVKTGDSLWKIVEEQLDELGQYEEIIEINKDKYPSLIDNPEYLDVGWQLTLPCQEDEEEELGGYTVKVKVVDTDKKPVENAKVTLYSDPKETTTNENGEAVFEDIEKGEHRLVVAYKGQVGEQNLNLKGEVEEFDFTIQIKATNPLTSPMVLTIIGILVLLSAFLFIRMQRLKVKKLG